MTESEFLSKRSGAAKSGSLVMRHGAPFLLPISGRVVVHTLHDSGGGMAVRGGEPVLEW